jgi:hypothetical protein
MSEHTRTLSRPWTPAEDALLVQMTDREVRRATSRNRIAVFHRRRFLHVPPWTTARRKARWSWTAERDALLGTRPDVLVAEQLGLAPRGVLYRRQGLGIPAYVRARR